jgi:hypothetical protein
VERDVVNRPPLTVGASVEECPKGRDRSEATSSGLATAAATAATTADADGAAASVVIGVVCWRWASPSDRREKGRFNALVSLLSAAAVDGVFVGMPRVVSSPGTGAAVAASTPPLPSPPLVPGAARRTRSNDVLFRFEGIIAVPPSKPSESLPPPPAPLFFFPRDDGGGNPPNMLWSRVWVGK